MEPPEQHVAITIPPPPPPVLAWKDLTVSAKGGRLVLLHNVSGVIEGGLCAVMGPSGSGKTTLLNALALRLDPKCEVAGERRLNGRPYGPGDLKQVSGYVMQDDLLNAQLTVHETLAYAARLRCPPALTDAQRAARVERALSDMGLGRVRDVIVGSPLRKGISGGERKRLCVALELITRPRLLFLDEPTSGLDSSTALRLVRTLRALAEGRRPPEQQPQQQQRASAAAAGGGGGGGGADAASSLSASSTASGDGGAASELELTTTTAAAAATAAGGGGDDYGDDAEYLPTTIVCTLHQPSSKIFALFNSLLLLQRGAIVFHGPAAGAVDHFAAMGYALPPATNPADHVMDLLSARPSQALDGGPVPLSPGDMLEASMLPAQAPRGAAAAAMPLPRAESLLRAYNAATARHSARHPHNHHGGDALSLGADAPPLPVRALVPWRRQFRTLFGRALRETLRKRDVLVTQLVQAVLIAALIGTVFLRIGTGQSSAVRRQPLLFFCVINQGLFAALCVINSFPSERLLVLRERAAGSYYSSAYFCAKSGAELLLQLPIPVVFSCVVYFLSGLTPQASKFFIFAAFMVMCNMAATSLALLVSTWCRTVDLSVSVLPFALEVCRLFGAFFLSPKNTPAYWEWLNALSYVKWTYVGVSLNELTGLKLTCTAAEAAAANKGGACPIATGEQTIQQLGLDKYPIGLCAGVLVAYILVLRVLAWVGLRVRKW